MKALRVRRSDPVPGRGPEEEGSIIPEIVLAKKETFIPEQSPCHAAAQVSTDNPVHTTSSYNPSSDLSNKKI